MGPIGTLGFILEHPFNRGRPLAALARYVGWQVGSRIARGPLRVPFVDDIKLIASSGMAGATGNIYCGLHEFEDMGFALHLLRPGDLFVDVGANVGSYSLLAAAAGADVIAFEPGEAFPYLKRNAEGNDLAIDCRCEAIGASQGTLRFTTGMDTTNRAALEGETFVEVPMTTLDAAINRPPALVKIDVEGFEDAVTSGGARVIPMATALIIEGVTEELAARLFRLGFLATGYDPIARNLTAPAANRANTIFVRGDVTERLKSAPQYRICGRLV